jgi:transposase
MTGMLIGIEGAEVLLFVEDEESEEGAFGILIEMPSTETSCPTCGGKVVELDPVTVELPPTRAAEAHVLVAWKRRQWRCADSTCPQEIFDEQNEEIDRFIARVAPRRRSKELPLLSAD